MEAPFVRASVWGAPAGPIAVAAATAAPTSPPAVCRQQQQQQEQPQASGRSIAVPRWGRCRITRTAPSVCPARSAMAASCAGSTHGRKNRSSGPAEAHDEAEPAARQVEQVDGDVDPEEEVEPIEQREEPEVARIVV